MSNKQIEDLVDLMFDTDMEEIMKEKSTLEYIHKLQQENNQLKEKIDRVISFIKILQNNLKDYTEYEEYTNIFNEMLKDILGILGEKENE